MSMHKLFIYHGNCLDGFTSAWVAHKAMRELNEQIPPETPGIFAQFYAGIYGEPWPRNLVTRDTEVYLLDFSYRPDVMREIAAAAQRVFVLDHHVSAIKALEADNFFGLYNVVNRCSTNKSGAGIAWSFFFPAEIPPKLVSYVQDRDLWQFHLWQSQNINEYLFSFSYSFETWNTLAQELDSVEGLQAAEGYGAVIIRKKEKDMQELIDNHLQRINIGDHTDIPAINAPYFWASELGNKLCKQYEDSPFAAVYYYNKYGKAVISLRSIGDKFDVSKVAFSLGGGGHRNAAGFTADRVVMSSPTKDAESPA